MATIFNRDQTDLLKQDMFFGDAPNIARYDQQRYPVFEKSTSKQMGYFWIPNEVDISKDIRDFKKLQPHERHIFIENLKYQILLDSVQGRAPTCMLPYVSVPELEVCIQNWAYMECIHSRSYTYIIQNLFTDPGEVFDDILKQTEILERAESVTKHYDEFIEYAKWFSLLGIGKHTVNGNKINITKRKLYKCLYRMICSINILEAIRFYASFVCTWSFSERNLLEGCGKIVELIARDEAVHQGITTSMIKILRKDGDSVMQSVMDELEPEIYQMYEDAVQQEKDWSEYLFQHGSVLGLNAQILGDFVEYRANRSLQAIGLKKVYNQPQNPLSWTQTYMGGDFKKQLANQETENTSYVLGALTGVVEDSELKLDLD